MIILHQGPAAWGLANTSPFLEMGKADSSAVAKVLGDKPFLLGEQPTTFDASA